LNECGAVLQVNKPSFSQPEEYILSDGEDVSDTENAGCRVCEHVQVSPCSRFCNAVLQLLNRVAPSTQTVRARLLKRIASLALRFLVGWFSRKTHPPRCINAVAMNPNEVLLSWTPTKLQNNCIYRESYICAWRQVTPSWRVQEPWCEKIVAYNLYENTDGDRWATHLLGLPENSAIHIRMCARNCWGRSSWSPEIVKVTTRMRSSELADSYQPLPLISVQSSSADLCHLDFQTCTSTRHRELCLRSSLDCTSLRSVESCFQNLPPCAMLSRACPRENNTAHSHSRECLHRPSVVVSRC